MHPFKRWQSCSWGVRSTPWQASMFTSLSNSHFNRLESVAPFAELYILAKFVELKFYNYSLLRVTGKSETRDSRHGGRRWQSLIESGPEPSMPPGPPRRGDGGPGVRSGGPTTAAQDRRRTT